MTKIERSVLFAHDGPLYCNELECKYFGVHYDDKLISRYSFFGNQITFIMRLKRIESSESNKFSIISSSNFSVTEVPDFKSIRKFIPNYYLAKRIIRSAVMSHDIIIVRLPSSIGAIAFDEAKKQNKPVLIEFVACVFDALWNYDWRGKLLAHYKLYSYRNLMLNASHTIYVTKRFLQERYPTKGKSIGCSDVEISSLDKSVIDNRIKKIESKTGYQIMGTVAALDVPYKGQADVINAISILKRQGIYLRYRLVGQGDPSYLKEVIEKADVGDLVEIIGPLPHSEVFGFLEGIDIYIQPSKQEGLPRSLVEAMSKACPSLGARTAGIPELIRPECIFTPGSVAGIVQALKRINPLWMKEQAIINFDTVKAFQKIELDQMRKEFYQTFLKDWDLKVHDWSIDSNR